LVRWSMRTVAHLWWILRSPRKYKSD